MLNQNTCPRCGANLTNSRHCDYCGKILLTLPNPAKSPILTASAAPGSVSIPSSELASLKRPKAGMSSSGGVMLLLFAIPWTSCILLGFFFMGARFLKDSMNYVRLSNQGETAHGIVTGLNVDDSGDSTSYDVSYRFRAPLNGAVSVFEKTESVSETVYNGLESGGSMDVAYVRSDPNTSAVKANLAPPDIKTLLFFLAIELIGIVIGGWMLSAGIKVGRTFMVLRSKGEATQAIVFDRWEESGSDSSSYYVAYAYRAPGFGNKIFTNAEQSLNAFRKLKIGDKVALRYLPDDPKIVKLTDFNW